MIRMNRRDFLAYTSAAAAAASLQSSAATGAELRKPRTIRPDEKMNVACIGIGGKGQGDTMAMENENVVGLCDIDLKTLENMGKKFPNAKRYQDYRKMLAELDEQIDAVTISTPDHTHYPAALDAITRGKHTFVQKPLSHTVWEARQLAQLAKKHGVATQMGNQGHAAEGPRVLAECLYAGAIGDVHEAHIWTNRPTSWGVDAGKDRPTDTPGVPENIDWNLWLGSAPWRPYHPMYMPKKWRTWWDFGTGALGDMGCHIMDAPYWILDLGWPEWIEAESSPVNNETIPKWSVITYQFPARNGRPATKLVWYDGGKLPERPKELENGRDMKSEGGQIYYGDKGVILADSHAYSWRIIPESKMREFLPNKPPVSIPRSPGHVKEWVDACKGGQPAGSDFVQYAGALTEVVLLGNLALRAGERIVIDQETLEVNTPAAARQYVTHGYRAY